MSRAARIQAHLLNMQVGDVVELPGRFTHADVHSAVQTHCRREIMRELLSFNITSKAGIVTVERLPFDV